MNIRADNERYLAEHRRLVREALYLWRKESLAAHQEWVLETVRTLALVNAAGLAGVAAIYASDKTTKLLGSYPSGAFFFAGLACAALTMHQNSLGFHFRQQEIKARIDSLDSGELNTTDALRPATRGAQNFRLADVLGWSSGALFLVGAWPFIKVLWPF